MGGKDIEGEIGEHSSWERDLKASQQQDSCGLVYQGVDSHGEELKHVETGDGSCKQDRFVSGHE